MLQRIFAFTALLILAGSCSKDATDYGPVDKKIIEEYIASHNLTAQSTASGLYYVIDRPGGTNHPNINSIVVASYNGYFTNDSVFDESYSSGKPINFSLNAVIKGWQEGLQLIGVNGKIKLLIPSSLGYGASGKGSVPPNTVIIFDVELVEFY